MSPIHARDRRSTWTQAQVHQLQQRWQTGASASRIARELGGGISRDAVLSKVRRLRLAQRRTHGHPVFLRSEDRVRPWHEVPSDRLRLRKRENWRCPTWVATAKPHVDDSAIDLNIPPAQRRSLLELGNESCRWPVGDPARGDFFFCGRQSLAHHPYCADHCARAYRLWKGA
jgi:GcrA cell cycle regulator